LEGIRRRREKSWLWGTLATFLSLCVEGKKLEGRKNLYRPVGGDMSRFRKRLLTCGIGLEVGTVWEKAASSRQGR